jgi:hypothetical protein
MITSSKVQTINYDGLASKIDTKIDKSSSYNRIVSSMRKNSGTRFVKPFELFIRIIYSLKVHSML